jgi:hypothetical protein
MILQRAEMITANPVARINCVYKVFLLVIVGSIGCKSLKKVWYWKYLIYISGRMSSSESQVCDLVDSGTRVAKISLLPLGICFPQKLTMGSEFFLNTSMLEFKGNCGK